ncbi:uncharacterized protein LOC131882034 [Tigriopus californicus]|uniref:uncharacterized protein LOC131882034 n=1 Tax=Tigriopus californicus TaxID=6832 RepID=UPI0027DA49F8|nr:uncharacterized protein LOC131882034 [Tigriopus californicus]
MDKFRPSHHSTLSLCPDSTYHSRVLLSARHSHNKLKMAINKKINKSFTKKVTQSLKLRILSKLPWMSKREQQVYEELPSSHPHQVEMDENLLNEALEARLMELIASSPAQKSHIKVQLEVRVPATDLFDFGGSFVCSQVQTRCQEAQAQVSLTTTTASQA